MQYVYICAWVGAFIRSYVIWMSVFVCAALDKRRWDYVCMYAMCHVYDIIQISICAQVFHGRSGSLFVYNPRCVHAPCATNTYVHMTEQCSLLPGALHCAFCMVFVWVSAWWTKRNASTMYPMWGHEKRNTHTRPSVWRLLRMYARMDGWFNVCMHKSAFTVCVWAIVPSFGIGRTIFAFIRLPMHVLNHTVYLRIRDQTMCLYFANVFRINMFCMPLSCGEQGAMYSDKQIATLKLKRTMTFVHLVFLDLSTESDTDFLFVLSQPCFKCCWWD